MCNRDCASYSEASTKGWVTREEDLRTLDSVFLKPAFHKPDAGSIQSAREANLAALIESKYKISVTRRRKSWPH